MLKSLCAINVAQMSNALRFAVIAGTLVYGMITAVGDVGPLKLKGSAVASE